MRLTHFFVDRPILSSVLSILLTLVGAISYFQLPVTQYPEITPPTISVAAAYPGASAETAAQTVASVLEEQINGVENMLYMRSENTADGRTSISVVFQTGTNLDTAQVLVQNRVALAQPSLPAEVVRQGVSVTKNSPDFLMVIHILSHDGTRDSLYVSNFTRTQVIDRLARVNGVGQAQIFGERAYAMRVWLNPERAAALNLTAQEIVTALRQNNVQVAAGVLNRQPIDQPGAFEVTVETQGRLLTPREFAGVIVKRGEDGRTVRLGDVARVELAAADYSTIGYLNGTDAIPIGVFQRPGSNALETAAALRAEMADIARTMPAGLAFDIVYDPTRFVQDSITEIYKTIGEAILLVGLVVVLFLGSLRASIIPILAIPVSLIGAMAVLKALGLSLNTLSLFGLVLSIGIVVDDAIVVVENVDRYIRKGMTPRAAAHKTMDEVGGALVAIALVLSAVFIPTAFIGGFTGAFYTQFALTIATATILSLIVSLTLSPALCAVLLKPHAAEDDRKAGSALAHPFKAFGQAFNRRFDWMSVKYAGLTRRLIRVTAVVLVVYGGLIALTGLQFSVTPSGFIPDEDKGYLIGVVQLPPGSSLDRTDRVMRQMEAALAKVPGIAATVPIVGLDGSTFTNAPNSGVIFLPLMPFEERSEAGLTLQGINQQAQGALGQFDEALAFVIAPPPVNGVGIAGGWKFYLQDRGGVGIATLNQAAQAFVGQAYQTPGLSQIFTFFNLSSPRVYADIDRVKAEMLNVPASRVLEALEVYLGSTYVNDFTFIGRNYRVIVQGDWQFRDDVGDIGRLRTRSDAGAMVPIGSIATFERRTGPSRVPRYNNYPAIEIQGSSSGISSGEAIATIEGILAESLPPGISYEWTELSLQEKLQGNTAVMAFGLAVVFVFLLLAALYESWLLPLAVILIVPMCLLAALAGVNLMGGDLNILVQIGFVVLIGLAAKNAILIVEFARQAEAEGAAPAEAAASAAQTRLRPIIMTSMAFILGTLPLMVATGAGAEMRQALGTAVVSGMLGVTLFGLLFTPVFYVACQRLGTMARRLTGRPLAEDVR
jgi:hydrophobe/amphiphile efflux-1 (HAE1) family protein